MSNDKAAAAYHRGEDYPRTEMSIKSHYPLPPLQRDDLSVPGKTHPCVRRFRRGWYCTRTRHTGPCALVPRWWNLRARLWMHRQGIRG